MSHVANTQLPEQDKSSRSLSSHCSEQPMSPGPQGPQVSRRVHFYKSGDPHFRGLQVVISSYTFKSFDALLDSLSRKVPLPFGVRNITTPRGMHVIRTLDELEDGKSYLCSDKRKVLPIKLNVSNKRQLHRQLGQLARSTKNKQMEPEELPMVGSPMWLMVFRNGDPIVKHTLDLQVIQTWESVLKNMSDIVQVPVQKIFTTHGQRVASLVALALCSAVVVASAAESFRPARYNTRRPPTVEPQTPAGNTSSLSGSLKSKTHQTVNDSSTSKLSDFFSNHTSSKKTMINNTTDLDPLLHVSDGEGARSLLPPDDNVEKTFHIEEDGSMTVEMKVRLTVKEEESICWTTTLMRSPVAKKPRSGSDPRPSLTADPPEQDEIANIVRRPKSREDLSPVGLKHTVLNMDKPRFCRPPPPGPRHKWKQASVENFRTSGRGVAENVACAYSCTEEGPGRKVTNSHRLIKPFSFMPIPKPRVAKLAGPECNKAYGFSQASEVHQMQDKQEEITDTVLHRYDQQSCYSKEFNIEGQKACEILYQYSVSANTVPSSSSYDQDTERKRIPITSNCLNEAHSNTLSLLSDVALPSYDTSPLSCFADNESAALNLVSKLSPGNSAPEALIQNDDKGGVKPSKRKPEEPNIKKNRKSPAASPDPKIKRGTAETMKDGKDLKSPSQTEAPKNLNHEEGIIRNEQKLKKAKILTGNKDGDAANVDLSIFQNSGNSRGLLVQKKQNVNRQRNLKGHPCTVSKSDCTLTRDMSNILPYIDLSQAKQMSMSESTIGLREGGELRGHASLNIFSSDVNEYMENCLDRIDTKSIHCLGNKNTIKADEELRVLFQTGSDSTEESEIKDDTKMLTEKACLPSDHHLNESQTVNITSEEVIEKVSINNTQNSKTIPNIQAPPMKSGGLKPKASRPDSMLTLEQLYKSSRQGRSNQNHPSSLEKSYSSPDFQSHTASSFSLPSRFPITFLSTMSLNEGFNARMSESHVNNIQIQSEDFRVKSLQKAASMKDVAELKANLKDLQNSTSFLKSWRSLVELNGRTKGCTLSSCNSLNKFNQVVNGENCNKVEETPKTKELRKEFGMSEEFKKDLLSPVRGKITVYDAIEQLNQSSIIEKNLIKDGEDIVHYEHSENHTNCEDSEVSTKDDETTTFKRGSYHDDKIHDKEERGSFEETNIRSGVSDKINAGSHSPLGEQSTKDLVNETSDMCSTSNLLAAAWEEEQEEKVEEHALSRFVEIPMGLLDLVNSTLHPTALSFSYDSKGKLKIDVEGTSTKLIHRIPRNSTDVQCVHKQLPSPDTSDLSDYRPDITDSDEFTPQESAELISESGEDDFAEQPNAQGCVQWSIKRVHGEDNCKVADSVLKASFSSPPAEKDHLQATSFTGSLASFNSSRDRVMADMMYFTSSSLEACNQPKQCTVQSASVDMSKGVLTDKGQWLLKENHLIRMSPPLPMGMYENADTTSASSGQDNASDDIPGSYFFGPASTLAALSSSDLEDMTKPWKSFQFAYFAVPHGSDSDPFQNELNSRSCVDNVKVTSQESVTKEEGIISNSATRHPETRLKSLNRLNSFTTVEVKIPDSKVHPVTGPSGVVPAEVQHARTQSHRKEMDQEQHSVNRLNFACGPHCSIL